MSQVVLSEIKQNIAQLSADEQLLLISWVVKGLRGKLDDVSDFERQLAEMANDPDIQRELKEIEEDFRHTELDGLEQ